MGNVPKYRAKIEAGLPLEDEDRIALALDLKPLLSTEGWAAFTTLVRRMRQETLEDAIVDLSKPREFYAGRIAAIDELGGMLVLKVAEGEALLEKGEDKPRVRPLSSVVGVMRPGGGGFMEG